MKLARRHVIALAAAIVVLGSLAVATWAEWRYFQDQARSHHEPPPGFWDAEHVHDWLYNAAMNWQSEAVIGVAFVLLLKRVAGDRTPKP